jgi:hypothetical protein
VHVETTILRPVPTNEYQELRPDTSPPSQLLKAVPEPFSFEPIVSDPSTGRGGEADSSHPEVESATYTPKDPTLPLSPMIAI